MSSELSEYLDPKSCPADRPPYLRFSSTTRQLHDSVDASMRRHGVAYLHPEDPTLQLDMLGSRHMSDWQERKVTAVFEGECCWSDLHQFYARYGVEVARELIGKIRELEAARGVLLTDCGMQAVALTVDTLAVPGGHAILMRGSYNKSRRYLEWLSGRLKFELTIVDELDQAALRSHIRENTFLVFGETYTNPRLLALDPEALGSTCLEARREGSRSLRLVIDDTIVTPWGLRTPLLETPGVDVVVASGTKALGGQDRDLWGYIASNQVDFLNETQDLIAMRGGALDWRRARVILEGLDAAREAHEKRCQSATEVARFLANHPAVEEVHHPSLPDHPQRELIERHYTRPASLLSFRVRGLDEERTRHFGDVLATCRVFRYAGSFDGLTSKVNHHRTVSEYFTQEEELEKAGITRLIRLGIGTEPTGDLIASLNWALHHHASLSEADILEWQRHREKELGLPAER